MKMCTLVAVVVLMMGILGGEYVAAEVHHVVGEDRGWDSTSDLASWSSAKTFRVGDQLWFTYSVAQGLVAELKSREEYEACDVSNPIKMYTEGLHSIPLEREGIRYFVSSDPENCNTGLKLHVHVLPKAHHNTHSSTSTSTSTLTVEAAGPTTPSASARYAHNTMLMLIIIFCLTMGLAY